ncbi:MAG: RusA family crossover junction endodeoxyribonuclease [Microcoleaceae cyanobacterium]
MLNALLTSKPTHSFTELDAIKERIYQEHQRCIHSPQTALIHACNAGIGLLQIQSQLPSSQWQQWLTTDCPVRLETAQLYMQMATKCADYPRILSPSSTTVSDSKLTSLSYSPNPINPPKNYSNKNNNLSSQTLTFPPSNPSKNSPKNTKELTEKLESSPQPSQSPFSVPAQKVEPSTPQNPTLETPPEAVIDVDFIPATPPPSASEKTGIIRFCLAGNVVPKARPRVTSHGTHLPQRYRAWRNQAEVELYRQMCELHPAPKFPLQKAAISLRFFGNHRTNSDIDNLAGACLDALTLNGAGILKDDRLSCLPQLSVEFVPGTPETGVWIEIEPLI